MAPNQSPTAAPLNAVPNWRHRRASTRIGIQSSRLPEISAVIVLLAATVVGCGEPAAGPAAGQDNIGESRVVVRVAPAERRTILQTVDVLGRCEAAPENLAVLTPVIEGRVDAILVQQGAQVTAGQAIVQLDPTLAAADLAEKQAERDSLVAERESLQSLPREKEQEAGRLAIENAKIAVAGAEAVVERLRPVLARNEISQQQMFEAEQALAQARLGQQTAEAQFDVLMLPPRPEAVAEVEARIKAAQQAIASSQVRLDLLTIRAPIDGVLDRLTCRLGQTIAVGADVGLVVDTRRMLVQAWLPIASVALVQNGQSVEVHTIHQSTAASAASESPDQTTITGQIVSVGRVADAQTGSVPVRVLVDNADGVLVIGQTVEATIQVDESGPTLAVPQNAIHDEGDGPALTVVRGGKSVVLHPDLGGENGGWVAVSAVDLREGEPVIVAGAYNLPEGTPVKSEPADELSYEPK